MKYIVSFSGGMDSATLLWMLHAQGHELIALSFDYGQRHRIELKFAKRMIQVLGIEHMIIKVPFGAALESSALTADNVAVPDGHYAAANMQVTVVPNRNMIFMSIAAAIAIDRKFDGIAYAAHAGDHTIYPDCREEFVKAFEETVKIGNALQQFTVLRPFINMTKAEIVKLGNTLTVPYGFTHSCYKNKYPPCGKCGTCVERTEAFQENDLIDPLLEQKGSHD